MPKHGNHKSIAKFMYKELQDKENGEKQMEEHEIRKYPIFITLRDIQRITTIEHINDTIINMALEIIMEG